MSTSPDNIELTAMDGQLLITPNEKDAALDDWARAHKHWLEEQLVEHAAVLLRDFDSSMEMFRSVGRIFGGELLKNTYASTPRKAVGGNAYTATEYPADQTIVQHSEDAYTKNWPMKLAFYCEVPPSSGGETPLASTRKITATIPDSILEKFRQKGVQYVRNYHPGIDLPWQEVFDTEDPDEVESICARRGIESKWMDDGSLRTIERCQGLATHPVTNEEVWFNQAHLFHSSNLAPDLVEALLMLVGDERSLPRNTFYGDASPIEPETLQTVRDAIEENKTAFRWERGDVLLVDNMLTTHGRNPFTGERKLFVAMMEPFSTFEGGEVYPDFRDR